MHKDLNKQARDNITGYKGTIIARCEWNNGCVRLTLQAKGIKDGKPIEAYTADIQDVEIEEPKEDLPKKNPTGGPRVGNYRAKDPK